jgi:hypothetical protein
VYEPYRPPDYMIERWNFPKEHLTHVPVVVSNLSDLGLWRAITPGQLALHMMNRAYPSGRNGLGALLTASSSEDMIDRLIHNRQAIVSPVEASLLAFVCGPQIERSFTAIGMQCCGARRRRGHLMETESSEELAVIFETGRRRTAAEGAPPYSLRRMDASYWRSVKMARCPSTAMVRARPASSIRSCPSSRRNIAAARCAFDKGRTPPSMTVDLQACRQRAPASTALRLAPEALPPR